jgi:small subunit ribosomal protein S2
MPRKKKTEEENKAAQEAKAEEKAKSGAETAEAIEKKEKKTRKKKTDTEDTKQEEGDEDKIEKLKRELEEKAKKLEGKIDKKPDEEQLKEEVRADEKKRQRNEKTLFPLDDYVKYSAHLGTKAVTPNMRQFVYKRRADGLAVLNTNSIDQKLKEACEFLAKYNPGDIFIACKREAGWKATKKFSEVTGIKAFTKKYPAGVITNTQLEDFFEVELVIICDPWLDKNALNDTLKVKKPIIGLCDTNNLTTGLTKIIPCNNKSMKSLGIILYLLAREYLISRKMKKEADELKIEDFTGMEESEVESREVKKVEKSSSEEHKKYEKKDDKRENKGAKEGV